MILLNYEYIFLFFEPDELWHSFLINLYLVPVFWILLLQKFSFVTSYRSNEPPFVSKESCVFWHKYSLFLV